MHFATSSHTGIASNAILRITDYKTIHTLPSLYVNSVFTITTLNKDTPVKSKAQELIRKFVIKIKRFSLFSIAVIHLLNNSET